MNNLTLRQMRAFRSVAAEGGFAAASKKLNLTPAALSALIKEAENQLGVRLFDRSTRNVALSTIGQEFLPLVERMLLDFDTAVENVANLRALQRGIVRLAAPEVLSCTLVPRVIAAFRAAHPQVEVRFLDVPIEDVIDRTIGGEVDLGLGTAPISEPDLVSLPFGRVPMMFVVRRDDALANRRSIKWADVQDRTYVTNLRHPQDWLPPATHQSQAQLPKDIVVVRRLNTALAMVESGKNEFTTSSSYVRGVAAGFGLKMVPMSERMEREYSVLTRNHHSLSPQVEAFKSFLIAFAREWSTQPENPTRRRRR